MLTRSLQTDWFKTPLPGEAETVSGVFRLSSAHVTPLWSCRPLSNGGTFFLPAEWEPLGSHLGLASQLSRPGNTLDKGQQAQDPVPPSAPNRLFHSGQLTSPPGPSIFCPEKKMKRLKSMFCALCSFDFQKTSEVGLMGGASHLRLHSNKSGAALPVTL